MSSFYLKLFVEDPKSPRKLGGLEIRTEFCYHIVTSQPNFYHQNKEKLHHLLSPSPFRQPTAITEATKLSQNVLEIGPRVAVKTSTCTNILSAFKSAGIENISRIERSLRYEIGGIVEKSKMNIDFDKMTEEIYDGNVNFLETSKMAEPFYEIDILSKQRAALEEANKELGLALDEKDLHFYYDFFANKLARNPTDVELFDLAQSDSEHSRHWFFRGHLVVDGMKMEESLMTKIKRTLETSNKNSLIAFHDNSSAIRGFDGVLRLRPQDPAEASPLLIHTSPTHLIYSAETHNFPTAVCPFQGATTGTGGRIRDIHATGRGAYEIAGTVGYSFGNLRVPGWTMEWEDEEECYPTSLSDPLKIAIEASNGASDYGNKFGEPQICGFARSFGLRLPDGERAEYLKPIMFSGGIGSIDDDETRKLACQPRQVLAKIGGPVYRIGVGGGAASSRQVQGAGEGEEETLDYAAVQRGDAEMAQKVHRVVRACAERDGGNPLLSIHDQGAGGNGNVIKELVEGCGVTIDSSQFEFGDSSVSLRELWTAEYQENDAALIDPQLVGTLQKIAQREKCNISLIGHVTEEQRVRLKGAQGYAVDLDTKMLGEREMKTFNLETRPRALSPLKLPENLTIRQALERVLRLPSVASKRYLTCKVDRSVTGLIAQQQCVGPLHTPLADVGIVALSHFDKIGGAVALGEQPIKMLVDVEKGVRLCLAETLLNLVWAPITDLKDVKMSGNWMWAAKCDGEGARLVAAVGALCEALHQVGCAIDGGKDSLSMAVMADGEVVKSPGTLVLSAYAPCPDITKKVTPDFKTSSTIEDTIIIHISFTPQNTTKNLGGTALAQVFGQIGDTIDDVTDFTEFAKSFAKIQELMAKRKILAGHDVSDGGLLVAILEMAFGGNCGVEVDFGAIEHGENIGVMFSEAPAVVIEVEQHLAPDILAHFGTNAKIIGATRKSYGPDAMVEVKMNGENVLVEKLVTLREIWEELGDRLGEYQTDLECLKETKIVHETTKNIGYKCDFEFEYETDFINDQSYFESAPRIAIIREEGSNGDREMAAAFTLAGFQTFDITMTDLLHQGHTLYQYQGVAFVGGFSYADALGSAKGWAAGIRFNARVRQEFDAFLRRSDTFSFGVCNGCQLMALLGWVGVQEQETDVFLEENRCARFESTFGPVKIVKNNKSIMLANMDDAILGLWSSHGEGRFTYSNPDILKALNENGQICVRFTDSEGKSARDYGSRENLPYPMNPNGSIDDVAAICSPNGRHLAMMPHSDRSFLTWQWPNYPFPSSTSNLSPWIKMFRNAYDWCKHQSTVDLQ